MRALLFPIAFALLSTPALAEQPWLEPGDIQARQDVETLKAARYIKGPVESWPLPWRQLDEGVQAALADRAPPHVRAAANRLSRLADYAEQKQLAEVRAGGTNAAATIRGFDWTAREQADVSVRVTRSLGPLFVSSGVGYRSGQRGADYHFEPSYAALTLGNWLVYGGYVEKFWGVGYDGALQIGNTARPFPKIGVQRLYPYRPEPKFLRWIGPWRFDAFGGVLTERRPDGNNPAYLGFRFAMEPARGLEVNFTRTLITCGGGGRDPTLSDGGVAGGQCSPGSMVRAVIPLFGGRQPGDSLAGISVSFTRPVGPVLARIYYDAQGEDKAGEQQFEQVGQTGGAMLTGGIGDGGASWTVVGEYTDTLANFLFQGDTRPGSFYSNAYYFIGKYYRGDAIGHVIGGDSKLLTVRASVTDSQNRRWYAAYRDADLNFTEAVTPNVGNPANTRFPTRTKTSIVTAGTEWPTAIGDLRLEGRYMTDAPNTPGRDAPRGEAEVSWRTRF